MCFVFGFENHVWVAVGSLLCGVDLINAIQWAVSITSIKNVISDLFMVNRF